MSPFTRAAVLAVGTELLTPARTDTNSLAITAQLNRHGIDVVFKAIVGDDRAGLARTVGEALDRAELLVCCGGLGPTDDDVTRDGVADALGLAQHTDPAIAASIEARFAARGLVMPSINLRQARVPAGAVVLENRVGTAPGLWIPHGERAVLLLPGPPRELAPMLEAATGAHIAPRAGRWTVRRRVVQITGRTESHTEEAVRPLYAGWASAALPVRATILASLGQIELHLSARAADAVAADAALAAAVAAVEVRIGDDVYSVDGRSMEEVLGAHLLARGWRVAVAESCTGGLITSRLTDVAGSSRYVDRSVVVYSNEAKAALLGVPEAVIAREGAVSEAVARAMAEGVRARAGVDLGVGVTGVAGPGGGSETKPVGTVVVAAAIEGRTVVRTWRFAGARGLVKFQASQAALDLARRVLAGG
jgi:nicotinamide-nucleotide amidase